jgi:hypothetical protein
LFKSPVRWKLYLFTSSYFRPNFDIYFFFALGQNKRMINCKKTDFKIFEKFNINPVWNTVATLLCENKHGTFLIMFNTKQSWNLFFKFGSSVTTTCWQTLIHSMNILTICSVEGNRNLTNLNSSPLPQLWSPIWSLDSEKLKIKYFSITWIPLNLLLL